MNSRGQVILDFKREKYGIFYHGIFNFIFKKVRLTKKFVVKQKYVWERERFVNAN